MQRYLYSIMTDQASGPLAGGLKFILYLASFVYGLIVKIIKYVYRVGIFRRHQLGKPVISVGNITWGGVGKTPLVELIAEFIKQQDLKPVVLMRGYKGKKDAGTLISDEAMTLERSLNDVPVIVGKDRVQGATAFLEKQSADVFLLDDGFQHRRVKRDMDIVALDATNPFGNGCLIPRGILREDLKSLSRADLFVITKSDIGHVNVGNIKKRLKTIAADVPIIETIHQPECFERLHDGEEFDVNLIKDQSICSFCSIGDPQSFEKTLVALGAQLKRNFSFRDHHWYEHRDIQEIVDYAKSQDIQYIVTTLKDAVKLDEHADLFGEDLQCWILKMKIRIIHGKGEFFDRISHLLHR